MIRRSILIPALSNAELRPAVFLDRDGTLTRYVGFVLEPAQLCLESGSVESIKRLRDAGFAVVMVTNQSAVGRGMLTEARLADIHRELLWQLDAADAPIDGIYYCPDRPSECSETVIESHDRKPGPGMLLQAARDLQLDLAQSWMIGDRMSDVLAGINAGCRGSIRVRTGLEPPELPSVSAACRPDFATVDEIGAATDVVLGDRDHQAA